MTGFVAQGHRDDLSMFRNTVYFSQMHIIVFFANNNCNADVCDVWASPAYNDVMISRQSFTLICSHCSCSIFVSVCVCVCVWKKPRYEFRLKLTNWQTT